MLGYVFDTTLRPRSWFQFADDTCIVSAHQEDNQLLCNAFTKWTVWADLKIRVDKCHTIGMKKFGSIHKQYQPVINICGERIPPLEDEADFIYLGKVFNYDMSIDREKDKLSDELNKYLEKIDLLPLHPKFKIHIVQKYVYAKFRWRFSIYPLTETWITNNIDNNINRYIRKWLQIPISGNITHLRLPTKKLGMNLRSAKDIYSDCKLTVRRILMSSKNMEIKRLWKLTSGKNVKEDALLVRANVNVPSLKKAIDKTNNNNRNDDIWKKFMGLHEQNKIISFMLDVCPIRSIQKWQKMTANLPANIYNFTKRSLILSLSNGANLKKWYKNQDGNCVMCKSLQTQLHVFNFCKNALNRYKWRHDSVLKTIFNYMCSFVKTPYEIHCDIPGLTPHNPSELFVDNQYRPDIIIKGPESLTVIELTVPYETNLLKSRQGKIEKYRDITSKVKTPYNKIELLFFEVSSLGFVGQDAKGMKAYLDSLKINSEELFLKCSEVAIRCTYYIYCRRNKEWTNPELLDYS